MNKTVKQIKIGDNISVNTAIGLVEGVVSKITPSGETLNLTIDRGEGKNSVELNFRPDDTVAVTEPKPVVFGAMHYDGTKTHAHLFLSGVPQADIDEVKLSELLGCKLENGKLSWGPLINDAGSVFKDLPVYKAD